MAKRLEFKAWCYRC